MGAILVTGTSGYIGSSFAARAMQKGHEVIATARRPGEHPHLENGVTRVEKLDVLDPIDVSKNFRADAIVHCATAHHLLMHEFSTGMNLSTVGTRNVLEMAVRCGIRKLIFLSTIHVYGSRLSGLITEETPLHCQSGYALNHYLGEQCCRYYAETYGIDIVLLRPANVFGLSMLTKVHRPTLVPASFVKDAASTGRLILQQSGKQNRNFVYNTDLADACLHLLADFPSGCNIVNVASNWTPTILEIVQMTAEAHRDIMGSELKVETLSNEPTSSQEFKIESRLLHLQPEASVTSAHMVATIRELYHWHTAVQPNLLVNAWHN